MAALVAAWFGMPLLWTNTELTSAASSVPVELAVIAVLPAHLPTNPADDSSNALAADERSSNLHAAFTALWQSERRGDKARAVALWNVCVPAFLAAGTQAPSLQRAVAGLPADPRYDARRSAYADLFSRCKQFYGASNAALSARTSQMRRADSSGEASTIAHQAASTGALGDLAAARTLARNALATRDPFELFDLAGVASTLLGPEATPAQRIDAALQDVALPLAACALVLDCTINSLIALKFCAFEGACEGSVQDRLRGKYGADIEQPKIDAEVARLVAAMRSGATPEIVKTR